MSQRERRKKKTEKEGEEEEEGGGGKKEKKEGRKKEEVKERIYEQILGIPRIEKGEPVHRRRERFCELVSRQLKPTAKGP